MRNPYNLRWIFAPHTGAWIETVLVGSDAVVFGFAPHTGAWIETVLVGSDAVGFGFAPHTGAWIETGIGIGTGFGSSSHPTRVRGLKPFAVTDIDGRLFAPHTGAWIETTVSR